MSMWLVSGLLCGAVVAQTPQGSCDPQEGAWQCCSVQRPCGLGEGDCDSDQDCGQGLSCGENNCQALDSSSAPVLWALDCCELPPALPKGGKGRRLSYDGGTPTTATPNPSSAGSAISSRCPPGTAGSGDCCLPDSDGDGSPEACPRGRPCTIQPCALEHSDNCPDVPNMDQADADADGAGDACDDDADDDGWDNDEDNCPWVYNVNQTDTDYDKVGDECDNCPLNRNFDQRDSNSDGLGDLCDDDDDDDFVYDILDNCLSDYNPGQEDVDGDGVGDACDNCVDVANTGQEDDNNNLVGDACDSEEDTDRDGVPDTVDNCLNLPNADQLNDDDDEMGNECDRDDDNDSIPDYMDNCVLVSNRGQEDSSGLGRGDACREDEDGDGVPDRSEQGPLYRTKTSTDFRLIRSYDIGRTSEYRDAEWRVGASGREVTQLENSRAAMAMARRRFGAVTFSGSVYVNDQDDDDVVGLVFYYQNNKNFYSLTAAKTGSSQGGWKMTRVQSTTGHPSDELKDAIYQLGRPNNQSVGGQTSILWQHPDRGWQAETSHHFQLELRPRQHTIGLRLWQGEELVIHQVIKDPSGLQGGRLGLYSHSQDFTYWTQLRTQVLKPPRMLFLTCVDSLSVWLDGQAYRGPGLGDWRTTTAITYPPHTHTVAVACTYTSGPARGLLASSLGGLHYTRREDWVCTGTREEGWQLPGHKTDHWPQARELGTNGEAPWGPRPDIDGAARWIWAGQGERTVYCRTTLF